MSLMCGDSALHAEGLCSTANRRDLAGGSIHRQVVLRELTTLIPHISEFTRTLLVASASLLGTSASNKVRY